MAGLVHLPVRAGRPLLGSVALAVHPRRALERVVALGGEHVDARAGEVVEAAGVIEVEMGEDDVANVRALEAEPLDLPDGRQLFAEGGAQQGEEEAAQSSARI